MLFAQKLLDEISYEEYLRTSFYTQALDFIEEPPLPLCGEEMAENQLRISIQEELRGNLSPMCAQKIIDMC